MSRPPHHRCPDRYWLCARIWLTALTFLGAFLDVTGPWAVRYISGVMAYSLLLGWMLLAFGGLAIIAIAIVSMWSGDLKPDKDEA